MEKITLLDLLLQKKSYELSISISAVSTVTTTQHKQLLGCSTLFLKIHIEKKQVYQQSEVKQMFVSLKIPLKTFMQSRLLLLHSRSAL